MSPTKDRRRFSRIPFEARVILGDGTTEWQSQLMDISLKGALIDRPAEYHPEPGTSVTVSIHAPDDAFIIRMEGSVEHEESSFVGIECRSIDVDSATSLRRLVELNLGDSSLLNRELAELCRQ